MSGSATNQGWREAVIYTHSVDETFNHQHWPALEKDDAGLMEELFQLLTARAVGNQYAADGRFAATIAVLPPGLRAMAATHCLGIRLAIDSIRCSFVKF